MITLISYSVLFWVIIIVIIILIFYYLGSKSMFQSRVHSSPESRFTLYRSDIADTHVEAMLYNYMYIQVR